MVGEQRIGPLTGGGQQVMYKEDSRGQSGVLGASVQGKAREKSQHHVNGWKGSKLSSAVHVS